MQNQQVISKLDKRFFFFLNSSSYNPSCKQLSPVKSDRRKRLLNLVFVFSHHHFGTCSFNLVTQLQRIVCQVSLMIYYSYTLVIFHQFGNIKMNNIYNRLTCAARFPRVLSLGLKFICSSVNLCSFLNPVASRFMPRSHL